MDCPTRTIEISLPSETADRLEAYAERSNSPLSNAASRVIKEGLSAIEARYPPKPLFGNSLKLPTD